MRRYLMILLCLSLFLVACNIGPTGSYHYQTKVEALRWIDNHHLILVYNTQRNLEPNNRSSSEFSRVQHLFVINTQNRSLKKIYEGEEANFLDASVKFGHALVRTASHDVYEVPLFTQNPATLLFNNNQDIYKYFDKKNRLLVRTARDEKNQIGFGILDLDSQEITPFQGAHSFTSNLAYQVFASPDYKHIFITNYPSEYGYSTQTTYRLMPNRNFGFMVAVDKAFQIHNPLALYDIESEDAYQPHPWMFQQWLTDERILFAKYANINDIDSYFEYDLVTKQIKEMPEIKQKGLVSPDLTRVVYQNGSEFFMSLIDGSGSRSLFNTDWDLPKGDPEFFL